MLIASLSPAVSAGNQMRAEFPWLPNTLIGALESIADSKVVVPDLELDRQIHSVCLLSRVYNRLNSIMFDHVGHCFEHRPACVSEPVEITSIRAKPLSPEESEDYSRMFTPLLAEMSKLEGEGSMVNKRDVAPGVYTPEEYRSRLVTGSVTLQ